MIQVMATPRTILIAGRGVHVTELAPGFINAEMNRGAAAWPFVVPVEPGEATMARLVGRCVGLRCEPVLPWVIAAMILKLLPDALLRRRP